MADQQNDGRIEPKLDRVQRGQAITAEAWNKIVDRLNKPLDVSIRRTRRPKGKGGEAEPQEFTYATSASSTATQTDAVNPLGFAPNQFYMNNGVLTKKTTAVNTIQSISVVNGVLTIQTGTIYL
jgi:hypothetical protein